ncbi:MAG: hypothetical protein AB1422_17535 [bacterium]
MKKDWIGLEHLPHLLGILGIVAVYGVINVFLWFSQDWFHYGKKEGVEGHCSPDGPT